MIEFLNLNQMLPRNLLPAFLFRLRREIIEARIDCKFSKFEDDDGVWFGCFIRISGVSCAILMLDGVDLTPSLFLTADIQGDELRLKDILSELNIDRSEILSNNSGFSGEQIRKGVHILD